MDKARIFYNNLLSSIASRSLIEECKVVLYGGRQLWGVGGAMGKGEI